MTFFSDPLHKCIQFDISLLCGIKSIYLWLSWPNIETSSITTVSITEDEKSTTDPGTLKHGTGLSEPNMPWHIIDLHKDTRHACQHKESLQSSFVTDVTILKLSDLSEIIINKYSQPYGADRMCILLRVQGNVRTRLLLVALGNILR